MTTHIVNMNKVPGERYADNRIIVRGMQQTAGYCINEIPPGQMARQTFKGPLVPGPWAFAFGHPSIVTSDDDSTQQDMIREQMRGVLIVADLGDLLMVNGRYYRIERHLEFGVYPSWHFIDLVRVEIAAPLPIAHGMPEVGDAP